MNIGEYVLIERWCFDQGHRIDKYEIVAISTDLIELRHLAIFRKGADGVVEYPGSGDIIQNDSNMIKHLSIPFEERWKQHVADMRWLCEQLTK